MNLFSERSAFSRKVQGPSTPYSGAHVSFFFSRLYNVHQDYSNSDEYSGQKACPATILLPMPIPALGFLDPWTACAQEAPRNPFHVPFSLSLALSSFSLLVAVPCCPRTIVFYGNSQTAIPCAHSVMETVPIVVFISKPIFIHKPQQHSHLEGSVCMM